MVTPCNIYLLSFYAYKHQVSVKAFVANWHWPMVGSVHRSAGYCEKIDYRNLPAV